MSKSENDGWSPYLAGALAGLVLVLSVFFTGKYLGASTTFARAAGMIERSFIPDHVQQNAYYQKYKLKIDWQFMFVVGALIGSFISSITSGSFRVQGVPDMWAFRFGDSVFKRGVAAFLGGILVLFGARMAGGCPTGHGLSGMSQLSASGFVALGAYFIGGLISAKLVYGRGGGK